MAVLANPLRYAFDEQAKLATQFVVGRGTDDPPVAPDDEPGLEATGWYSPVRSTFANGAHAVVVETDPDTAEVRILRYCVVHDCGTLINPRIVEGQVHGGVAQGVGGALYERIVYDENGQLLNASFMDFLMPYASEVPKVEIDHLETPSPLNPLGIKGAGEAGTIPGAGRAGRGHLRRRGVLHRPHADLPVGAVGAAGTPRPEGGAMRIAGNATLHAPVEAVYDALRDPRVLVRTIPGCERLEQTGEDAYQMTVTAGVASVRGTYAGDVRLTDQRAPNGFVLRASGSGAPGTVSADVTVELSPGENGTTELSYDADAVVGGMIGGVGQRLLSGVAKRTAGDFFTAVDQVLAGGGAEAEEAATGDGVAPTGEAGPRVYSAPARRGAPGVPGGELAAGVVLGAAAALLGALVGGYLARRAQRR